MMNFILSLFWDGFFAAIAAIGFGSISNIPYKAFGGCAVLAAVGHAVRYGLMHGLDWSIIPSSFIAALFIGLLSVVASLLCKCPAESLSFPALLPMIPGMYAYRTVQALLNCMQQIDESEFQHSFYLLNYNWLYCIMIVVLMVIGVTLPIFVFSSFTFKATKR